MSVRETHGPDDVVVMDDMVHQRAVCELAQWMGKGAEEETDLASSGN